MKSSLPGSELAFTNGSTAMVGVFAAAPAPPAHA